MVALPTVNEGQAQVVLVGCGAPSRGMGWYHAVQMLKGKCPSAVLSYVVEPWFLGAGEYEMEERKICFMMSFIYGWISHPMIPLAI